MKKIGLRITFKFFILLIPFFTYSQDEGLQNWYNLELDYDLTKKLKLSLEGSGRQSHDFYFFIGETPQNTQKLFFDFNIKKKHNNFFGYSLGYRFILLNEMYDESNSLAYNVINNFSKKHRLYFDAYFNKKITKKFKMCLRTRYQQQLSCEFADNYETIEIVDKLREKIKLEYFLNNSLVFSTSIELFYLLEKDIEKIRYATGFKKTFGKTSINFSYMIQHELNNQPSDILMALRTKLSYSI
ncbi:MAG: hypothetical protein CMD26_01200 [Flavobacteriales bacterium]|nr:hypothetical protein [Flavobacteriales bacterium]|tara:strand:- start:411 stop:1136 length:726 start_codon:yes stop_codon:yes gene_type:complete